MSEGGQGEGGGGNVRVRRFEVDQNFEGWRLDSFLANRVSRLSRSRVGEIARNGGVELSPPRRARPGLRLRRGDVVTLRERLPDERVQDDEVEILYKDEVLLALNKPAGMLVHEAASQRLNTVQHYLGRAGFEGAEPVHRIDRETSGVLVCSLARGHVAPLREQFAGRGTRKVYRALALDPDGRWEVGQRSRLDTPLGLDPASLTGVRMGRGDLSALTHVEVLGRREGGPHGAMADLAVRIETGRQHQIRVHLALEGTPIAGDKLYGQTDDFFRALADDPDDEALLATLPFPRHALHAWRLRLKHPDTGEPVAFEAPLPAIWGE